MIYRIAKASDKRFRDLNQVCIKSIGNMIFVKDEDIIERWECNFKKIVREEAQNNSSAIRMWPI